MKQFHSFFRFCLSFLLATGCTTFDTSTNIESMSFTCTVPGGSVQLSGNPIIINGTTTTAGKTNHRLLCRITCTDETVPGGPWIDSKPVSSGAASFDIHALVDFDFDFDIHQGTDKVTEHEQLAADFTVEIDESYVENGAYVAPTWSGSTTPITVLKGGLSQLEYAQLYSAGSSFYTEYITGIRFLTKQPTAITVDISSISKLWFIPFEAGNYDVTITCQFSDGHITVDTYTQAYLTTKLYEVSVNPSYWTNWNAYLTANEVTTSQCGVSVRDDLYVYGTKSIRFFNRYFETITEFYFANQLGGADLVVCTGELKEIPVTEGTSWTRQQASVPSMKYGTKVTERKQISLRFRCNTGFKNRDERRALVEFFASQEVFWKTDRFGIPSGDSFGLIPVIIAPASYDIDTSSEDLKSVEFEFEVANFDKFI